MNIVIGNSDNKWKDKQKGVAIDVSKDNLVMPVINIYISKSKDI